MNEKYHEIRERCVEEAMYMIKNRTTVRATAKNFSISKSTVHKDVSERLKKINPFLYSKVRMIININKSERHMRGGLATKKKYLESNKES